MYEKNKTYILKLSYTFLHIRCTKCNGQLSVMISRCSKYAPSGRVPFTAKRNLLLKELEGEEVKII